MGRGLFDFADKYRALDLDPELKLTAEEQRQLDETSRRLFTESARSVVQIYTGRSTGSGFFIGDGTRVVTDAHGVLGSKRHTVMTTDGSEYLARIEKLDDINDLAVLKLEGLSAGQYKPMSLAETVAPASPAFALGHPHGNPFVNISPGRTSSLETQADYHCKNRVARQMEELRERTERLGEMLASFTGSSSHEKLDTCAERVAKELIKLPAESQEDARLYLARPNLRGLVQVHPGNSGGPLLDEIGKVIGVTRQTINVDRSDAGFVPVSKVSELLSDPGSKFNFHYAYERESRLADRVERWAQDRPVSLAAGAGAAGGAALLAARFFPGLTGIGAMVGGVNVGVDDFYKLSSSVGPRATLKNGLALTFDAAAASGGALALMTRFRTSGLLLAGGAFLARAACEYVPTRLELKEITRKDGTSKPPFSGDFLESKKN